MNCVTGLVQYQFEHDLLDFDEAF
uniref:Uncharacterized protein n=1 Tax=Arundo donax TaxID=35708 RepID=A0A0A9C612_ARUDO